MKEAFEKKYHKLEATHWWFKSRRKYITQILQSENKNISILDIGCSSGLLIHDLVKLGFDLQNISGIDISQEAINNCKKNGIQNAYLMDAQAIDLPKKSFDIIIASDCLEHLKDDSKALKNWYSLLKPNGKLIVMVPAFMFLWSTHDEVNLHYRRYTLKQLKSKLQSNNFNINKSGYWNFTLFPAITLFRLLQKILPKNKKSKTGDLTLPPYFINKLLILLLNFEAFILKQYSPPFGVSTFCIVNKL